MNNTQDKITITRNTFFALLGYARREQSSCEANAANALKKVQQLANDDFCDFWQDSVKFWQHESECAANVYKKALEEIAIA